MKVNSLEASTAGKNKTKDIHLPSIDVTFGSNRILYVSLSQRVSNFHNLPQIGCQPHSCLWETIWLDWPERYEISVS